MASIQKRGKTYQFTVSHTVNGKSKPIRKGGFRTKKEAQLAAAEIESQLSKGVLPHLTPVPIDEYFDKWVKLYKTNISVTTRKHYEYTSRAIRTYFESKPLQEITRHDYQMFINEFGSNKAKETVEKVNTHIRACVKDAVDEQIIHRDFTRNAVITWTTPSKKSDEKHLNYKESEMLLKEICKRLDQGLGYSLLLLGLTSGMRFGELVGLTRSDFDFDNNTIRINKTWGYLKRHPEGFGPTKNEQSNRLIKMDGKTMGHFKNFFKNMPTNIHQLVFYSPSSKYKVISNTNANKLLRKVLTELKIDPISMHGLRHTHASVLLYKKVSIYYVSERLGHGDIDTTLREYTHVIKELREKDELGTINTFERMIV
ncbi:site-specific integrase [Schinkia azotoformans]|uniref:site-specific integrase n=1 Tax=Schinkia azotoformans TaxID=1454 RepID=UPI002DBDCAB0|nr:site-specific integrase [Schinkia azotoformans]MEC1718421.1 site-specific integrase [Schinkia azotoformans]MEC1757979.1 site-specific integrase [Schinkia azotoformans]